MYLVSQILIWALRNSLPYSMSDITTPRLDIPCAPEEFILGLHEPLHFWGDSYTQDDYFQNSNLKGCWPASASHPVPSKRRRRRRGEWSLGKRKSTQPWAFRKKKGPFQLRRYDDGSWSLWSIRVPA
jgi:hypothetical protein